jgi:uncharacterized protein (DUF2141 family)
MGARNLTDMRTLKIRGEYVGRPLITEFPDVNGDGKIDILDISIVSKRYGQSRKKP